MPIFSKESAAHYTSQASIILQCASSSDEERAEACEVAGGVSVSSVLCCFIRTTPLNASFPFSKYYVGEYRKSLMLLQKAIALYNKSACKRSNEDNARLYLMYGLSHFRTGDSLESEKSLNQAISFCQLSDSNECRKLALLAKSIVAMAKVNQNSFKEANELAREALEMAEREYSKEGNEVAGFARLLLHVYLRGNDVGRAERLLKTSGKLFKPLDLVIYKAGLKLASGKVDEALCLLRLGIEENSIKTSTDYPYLIPTIFYNLSLVERMIADPSRRDSIVHLDHLKAASKMLEDLCNSLRTESILSNHSKSFLLDSMDPNVVNISPNNTADVVTIANIASSHVTSSLSENYLSLSKGGLGIKIQSGGIVNRLNVSDLSEIRDNSYGIHKLLGNIKSMLTKSFVVLRSGGDSGVFNHNDILPDKSDAIGDVNYGVGSNTEKNLNEEGNNEKSLQNSENKSLNKMDENDDDCIERPIFDEKNIDCTSFKASNLDERQWKEGTKEEIAAKVKNAHCLTNAPVNYPDFDNFEFEGSQNFEFVLARDIAFGHINLIDVCSQQHTIAANSIANSLRMSFGRSVPERASQKVKKARTLQNNKNQSLGIGSADIMVNSISNIDLYTLRSEILPMNSKLNISENENWMQWAIAASKGLGLGAFGHNGVWDNEVSYEYLRDVRSRLLQVEACDVKSNVTLALLNSKLSMQVIVSKLTFSIIRKSFTSNYFKKLNLRGECEKYIDECEEYNGEVGESSLQALVSRWKLDYNEWATESSSQSLNGTQRIKSLQQLLEKIKVSRVAFCIAQYHFDFMRFSAHCCRNI